MTTHLSSHQNWTERHGFGWKMMKRVIAMNSSSTSLVAILENKLENFFRNDPNIQKFLFQRQKIKDSKSKTFLTTHQFLYLFMPLVCVRYLSMYLNSSLRITWGEHFLTKVILKSVRLKFSP